MWPGLPDTPPSLASSNRCPPSACSARSILQDGLSTAATTASSRPADGDGNASRQPPQTQGAQGGVLPGVAVRAHHPAAPGKDAAISGPGPGQGSAGQGVRGIPGLQAVKVRQQTGAARPTSTWRSQAGSIRRGAPGSQGTRTGTSSQLLQALWDRSTLGPAPAAIPAGAERKKPGRIANEQDFRTHHEAPSPGRGGSWRGGARPAPARPGQDANGPAAGAHLLPFQARQRRMHHRHRWATAARRPQRLVPEHNP